MPLGAIIGAVGNVIGSTLNRPKTIPPGKQIQSAVRGARAAGLHGLAGVGANAQYTQIPGSPVGGAIAQGAAQVGRAVSNMAITKSEVEVNKAQAELLKMQAHSISREIAENARGGTTGARNVSDPTRSPGLSSTVGTKAPPRSEDLPSVAVPVSIPGIGQSTATNPDTPLEAETQLWRKVEEGALPEYARDLWRRNFDRNYSKIKRALSEKEQTMDLDKRQAYRNRRKKYQRIIENFRSTEAAKAAAKKKLRKMLNEKGVRGTPKYKGWLR